MKKKKYNWKPFYILVLISLAILLPVGYLQTGTGFHGGGAVIFWLTLLSIFSTLLFIFCVSGLIFIIFNKIKIRIDKKYKALSKRSIFVRSIVVSFFLTFIIIIFMRPLFSVPMFFFYFIIACFGQTAC